MQVTDTITKPLLSVSKVCEGGNLVLYGPAPEYKSFIVHDPNAIDTIMSVASACDDKTPQTLRRGTYHVLVRELIDNRKASEAPPPGWGAPGK